MSEYLQLNKKPKPSKNVIFLQSMSKPIVYKFFKNFTNHRG